MSFAQPCVLSAPDVALLSAIRARLAPLGDPERAAGQQAYLKSSMPFRGVTTQAHRPLVTALARERHALGRGVKPPHTFASPVVYRV